MSLVIFSTFLWKQDIFLLCATKYRPPSWILFMQFLVFDKILFWKLWVPPNPSVAITETALCRRLHQMTSGSAKNSFLNSRRLLATYPINIEQILICVPSLKCVQTKFTNVFLWKGSRQAMFRLCFSQIKRLFSFLGNIIFGSTKWKKKINRAP